MGHMRWLLGTLVAMLLRGEKWLVVVFGPCEEMRDGDSREVCIETRAMVAMLREVLVLLVGAWRE